MALPRFEPVELGRERLAAGSLPRHRHDFAYAALVLAGGYEEAGDAGRRRVSAGDVLIHRPFEAHLDRIGTAGAEILNLPLPFALKSPGAGQVHDADRIVRLAERSHHVAVGELLRQFVAAHCCKDDWPDRLAQVLAGPDPPAIADWAEANHLHAATVSRGFRSVYGVSPRRFAAEARARRTLPLLIEGGEPLCALAYRTGFADQAHMTRTVRALTGRTPGRWRQEVKSVQDD